MGGVVPRTAGWQRDRIFNDAWIKELSPFASLGYGAEFTLYTIDRSTPVFDPKEGKYVGGGKTVVWSGEGRVQPRRSSRQTNNNSSDTVVQTVQFQFDGRDVDIRTNMYIEVSRCDNNPVLEDYKYVITGVVDSSNLIERTVLTQVDTEV